MPDIDGIDEIEVKENHVVIHIYGEHIAYGLDKNGKLIRVRKSGGYYHAVTNEKLRKKISQRAAAILQDQRKRHEKSGS